MRHADEPRAHRPARPLEADHPPLHARPDRGGLRALRQPARRRRRRWRSRRRLGRAWPRPLSWPTARATISRCCAAPRAVRPRLIEADVHLHRGRLEVRHLKTLGPLPVLWDRWYLASPRTPRLELAALLDGVGPDTTLMLDLKGRDPRLSRRVARRARAAPPTGPVTVCSRSWRLLEPFLGDPARACRALVGSRRQLRALRRRFAGRRLGRDLDPSAPARRGDGGRSARARRADRVVAGGHASRRRGGSAAWGVDGVITERFEALAPALAEAAA